MEKVIFMPRSTHRTTRYAPIRTPPRIREKVFQGMRSRIRNKIKPTEKEKSRTVNSEPEKNLTSLSNARRRSSW